MTDLPPYAVDFRGHPACPCQAEWIPVYERHLQRLGIITGPLGIAQLIGFFSGSGSTHTGGGDSDFWLTGATADLAVREARQMGADPTWHRPPGWDGGDGSEHVHSGLRGCPHMSLPALAQIVAVDHNGDGLLGDAPDPGPRPLSGRTWREGIAWALQQEALMVTPEDEAKVRAIFREELATFAKTAGASIKVDMGDKAKWSLERALKLLRVKTS